MGRRFGGVKSSKSSLSEILEDCRVINSKRGRLSEEHNSVESASTTSTVYCIPDNDLAIRVAKSLVELSKDIGDS